MELRVLKAMCTSVSGRYARALFEVAQEKDALAATESSLLLARDLFSRRNPHRLICLRILRGKVSPDAERRLQTLTGFSDFFWRFLKTLTRYNRLGAIKEVIRLFSALVDETLERVSLTVFSACPLTEPQRIRLVEQLQALFQKNLSLTYTLDPHLLGGIKVQSDLLTLDASARYQIEKFIQEAREGFQEREAEFLAAIEALEEEDFDEE